MLVSRSEAEGMDVRADSKAEGSECGSERYVKGCTDERGAELKALVTNVSKVRYSTDAPGGQPPHLCVGSWDGEGDAHESVHTAD